MRQLRIVRDSFAGFEVQEARKVFGMFIIWRQPTTNTHATIEAAREWAKNIDYHMERNRVRESLRRLRGQVVEVIVFVLICKLIQ